MSKKQELIQQAEALGITTEGLTVDQLTAAIAEASNDGADAATNALVEDNPTVKRQKAAKALRAKKAKEVEAKMQKEYFKEEESAAKPEKKGKDNRPVYEDERGLQFRFKKSAPKTLNIDGVSRKISDLIKDDSVMLELVNGNSNYLEQKY